MKLKLMLMSLLISNNATQNVSIQVSDNTIYDRMISKELKADCEKINVNIYEMVKNNYDDDKIYRIIIENSIPNEVTFIYLPLGVMLSSLMLMSLFTSKTKDHESAKPNLDTSEIFKFYLSRFFKDNTFTINLLIILADIGVYKLIQNYRFSLTYVIIIFALAIPFICLLILTLYMMLFYGNDNKENLKKQQDEVNKIFQNPDTPQNLNNLKKIFIPELYTMYSISELLKIFIITQGAYMIYMAYMVNKGNTLQDKISAIKNNHQIMRGVNYLNEKQTEKIVELSDQKDNRNNYSY
jgi:hypothetical protein